MQGYIAFLKPRTWQEKLTATLDGGEFCHVELMVQQNPDDTWQTISSLPDSGVRLRNVLLKGEHWVKIPVDVDVEFCKAWYLVNKTKKYDYVAGITPRINFITGSKDKLNCVETVTQLLKLPKPSTWGLKDLYNHVR